jgi:hypothetical protein
LPSENEIITTRRKDAESRRIYEKAVEVAKRLGIDQGYRRHRYEGNGLVIQYDGEGPNLFIYYGTQGRQPKVFYESCTNGIEAYRPDVKEWIDELERLYVQMIPTKEAEEKAQAQREREAFIERWGEAPG